MGCVQNKQAKAVINEASTDAKPENTLLHDVPEQETKATADAKDVPVVEEVKVEDTSAVNTVNDSTEKNEHQKEANASVENAVKVEESSETQATEVPQQQAVDIIANKIAEVDIPKKFEETSKTEGVAMIADTKTVEEEVVSNAAERQPNTKEVPMKDADDLAEDNFAIVEEDVAPSGSMCFMCKPVVSK